MAGETNVSDARGVLVMAVQDLHDGESAMAERLPRIGEAVSDGDLSALITADHERSSDQAQRLEAIAGELSVAAQDEANVWLRAILDDADNDIESIERGPWRDIALVGALRKAKQAERVSYETAMALAQRLGMAEAATALTKSRDEEQAADQALAAMLQRLTSS